MELGAFSVSLGVKDLAKSKEFYSKLGFSQFAGTDEYRYAIMKNGETLVGLFEGMFEGAMLTFNPGWDQSAGEVNPFTDVRDIKAKLAEAGIEITQEQGEASGPGSFVVVDPDGFPVLVDQHR